MRRSFLIEPSCPSESRTAGRTFPAFHVSVGKVCFCPTKLGLSDKRPCSVRRAGLLRSRSFNKKAEHMKKKAATPSYRYYIRLSEQENADFLSLYERSGAKSRSDFIRSRIFSKPFKVITVDKSAVDFCNRLTEINAQIRKIGVLYNQTVRAINSYHSAKVAHTLLEKLESCTARLQEQLDKSTAIAEEMRGRWSQR